MLCPMTQVKSGEIPLDKVPYMQRKSGAWDNSDLAKDKKKAAQTSAKKIAATKWSSTDKAYAQVRRFLRNMALIERHIYVVYFK